VKKYAAVGTLINLKVIMYIEDNSISTSILNSGWKTYDLA
jgi:hypothetical protein